MSLGRSRCVSKGSFHHERGQPGHNEILYKFRSARILFWKKRKKEKRANLSHFNVLVTESLPGLIPGWHSCNEWHDHVLIMLYYFFKGTAFDSESTYSIVKWAAANTAVLLQALCVCACVSLCVCVSPSPFSFPSICWHSCFQSESGCCWLRFMI